MTKNETLLLESVSDRLEQVHKALYGNGDPSRSMMASQVRQEEAAEAARVAAVEAAVKAAALTTVVNGLMVSVNEHHRTIHLANLLKNTKFWGYGLLLLVGMNLLVSVGHPLVCALIKAWTGVVIP